MGTSISKIKQDAELAYADEEGKAGEERLNILEKMVNARLDTTKHEIVSGERRYTLGQSWNSAGK